MAFYTLLPGKVLEKWGSFIVTGLAMLIGGAVATVAVQPWTIPVEVSPELAGVMFAMIIVGTFAAYLFYLQGITDAGPVRAGLVGCVEPVSATVISAVWLGTPVGVVDVVGCAMIIGMVFLVTEREEGSGGAASYDGAAYDLPPFQGRATELGYYKARRATRDDFERAKALLEDGHRAMASLGIREGLKKYPSARRLMRSIDAGKTYVVVASSSDSRADGSSADEGRIIGMFALNPQGDPAYAHMTGAKNRRAHRQGRREGQHLLRHLRGQRPHARAAAVVRLSVLRQRGDPLPLRPRQTPSRVRTRLVAFRLRRSNPTSV